jgi:hydroxymethylbilane synthase
MSAERPTLTLRLGTRGSMLARMQSQMIADAVEKHHPHVKVELIICKTSGDKIQNKPLHEAGGKGLFTKELEEALLSGAVDVAVHSYKDVPVTMPLVDQSKLVIVAVPQREDVRDVLISKSAQSIEQLNIGGKVGTGSLRRRCQLLALRPDLFIAPIRGNIDTRLKKLRAGEFDAIILAHAGLKRSGLFDSTDMNCIAVEQMLPAAGQGALAIQCRSDDAQTRRLLEPLDDPTSHQCVDLERAVVAALHGDCHSPIAALAAVHDGQVRLRAAVGARAGELPVIRADASAPLAESDRVLDAVIKTLEAQDVRKLLGAD